MTKRKLRLAGLESDNQDFAKRMLIPDGTCFMIQAIKQTDRQTDRQTNRQTGRQADRQTGRQADRWTNRKEDILLEAADIQITSL